MKPNDCTVTVMQLFANANLKERKCTAYIRQENGECGCGRQEHWHQDNDVTRYCKYPDAKTKWNTRDHTDVQSSEAFGEIEFPGFGTQTALSPYARLDYETDPNIMWGLLHTVWTLPTPTLVISVTGGYHRFSIKKRLETAFKQGLIDVATNSGAWIITGGVASGVTKYVGEAIQEYQFSTSNPKPLTSIGIVAWGTVANRESLTDSDAYGLYPAVYNLRDCGGDLPPLDHNQTHFLLPDDGTEGHWTGSEMTMRENLETYIRTKCSACLGGYMCGAGQKCVGTPMVLLLVEGGQNSLLQVRDAVLNKIPVVIMKDTGRVADILSLAYQMTQPRAHNNEPYFNSDFEEDMTVLISHHLKPLIENDDVPVLLHAIIVIMQHRSLLTIFELNDETCDSMDKAVLSSLLKANKSNPHEQVELAMVWNRADIAKQQIFTLENRAHWRTINLDQVMEEAIIDDRADFVQLFMDSGGIRLKQFLTVYRLYDLYMRVTDESMAISLIFKSIRHRTNMFSRLFSCGKREKHKDDAYLLNTVGRIISFLLNDRMHTFYTKEKYVIDGCEKEKLAKIHHLNNPVKHLLLWSLMFNRQKMARMFWKMCNDPIGGALIAGQLLKSLAAEADCQEEVDLSCELENEANYYEELACGVLTACYNENKPFAHQLLTRELNNWGETTLFSLAESADFMNFMQLSCCQTKLTSLWYGQMVDYTHAWRIFLVLACPFAVSLLRFKNIKLNGPLALIPVETDEYIPARRTASRQLSSRKVSVTYNLHCRDPRPSNDGISAVNAIYQFYGAPVTKFYLCVGYYMLFLGVFTMVVLSKLHPVREFTSQGCLEIILWVWTAALGLDEVRQLVTQEAKSTMGFKVINYFKSFWNLLDLIAYTLCMSSIFLRLQFIHNADEVARLFYSIAIMLLYLRFMEFFYVSKTIGPKIIMIQKMLRDLLFFVCILMIFILSFGIAMEAMLYPNEELSLQLFIDAIYTPYWQIFGEPHLSRVAGNPDPACYNATLVAQNPDMDCPRVTRLVPLLSAIYMLLTNVLLLNLLIAMFSYTFEKVQENSEKVWRFYRYSLIHHFFDAPTVPAPFIVVNIICRLVDYCMRKYRGTHQSMNGFRVVLPKAENDTLTAFEKKGRETYLDESHRMSEERVDSRVTEAAIRINKVKEDLEEIKECLSFATGGMQIPGGIQRQCHEHKDKPSTILEARLQQHSDLLQKLVKTVNYQRK